MGLIESLNSRFRNWFGSKDSFYKSRSYMLGQTGAVYIDTDKPYELYHTIPQLRMIIGKKKKMFANVIPVIRNAKGEEIVNAKSEALLKLLYNPNCTQSMNVFLEGYLEQLDIYGNQFQYFNKPSTLTDLSLAIWNVSPAYMEIVLTGKVFEQLKIEDIIKHYKYKENGKQQTFETNQILYSKHADLDNPIIGTSPLKSLKHPLSNIDHAYKYRNVIMSEKGAIGILSNKSKDSAGALPLRPNEKERIEKNYRNQYGLDNDKMKILITEASLTWEPTVIPTKDMLLFEEVDEDTKVLIDIYGMNMNLFSLKASTFENVKNSIKQVYADTIQPCADDYFQRLGVMLQVEKQFGKGAYIDPSYEHIKILQADKKEGADLFKMHVESVKQLVDSGMLSTTQGIKLLQDISGIKI